MGVKPRESATSQASRSQRRIALIGGAGRRNERARFSSEGRRRLRTGRGDQQDHATDERRTAQDRRQRPSGGELETSARRPGSPASYAMRPESRQAGRCVFRLAVENVSDRGCGRSAGSAPRGLRTLPRVGPSGAHRDSCRAADRPDGSARPCSRGRPYTRDGSQAKAVPTRRHAWSSHENTQARGVARPLPAHVVGSLSAPVCNSYGGSFRLALFSRLMPGTSLARPNRWSGRRRCTPGRNSRRSCRRAARSSAALDGDRIRSLSY